MEPGAPSSSSPRLAPSPGRSAPAASGRPAASAAGTALAPSPPTLDAVAELPPPASPTEAVAAARAELELIGPEHAAGTSKLYARGDFLPLDDRRAMSTGDFVGRLRALFGETRDDAYVLRHRATGLIVTAYAAQSGPSYGGGDPPGDPAARESRLAAFRALPEPRATLAKPFEAMTPAEMLAYRQADHVYRRALMDARAHPAVARVIARLDALLSAVRPVDWKVTRYWGEDPTVYTEGVEDGEPFSEAMPPVDGLAYLLQRAERRDDGLLDASQGPGVADLQVVAYWGYHMTMQESASARPQLARSRARVQRAWFRLVERAHQLDPATRKYFLSLAEIHARPLGLDPAKAAAALNGPGPSAAP